MLLVFPVVAVCSLWGKVKGGNALYSVCRCWADAWFFLCGIYHKNLFETSSPDKKPYIFVANHISYLDIPTIFKAIRRRKIRVLGKAEMKQVPIFGFIYSRGAIMVDRSSANNRSKSVRQLKSVLSKGISIFIYPEGTFNETHKALKDFYDGAFRIAIESKTPIQPILFLDTYDRMNHRSIFSINPGKSRAVFLEEIDVESYSIQDLSLLKNRVYQLMEQKLIDYRATWIKTEDKG
ncbi:MAG: 1-acyl-sn-glycerol-3-phosphate acyltransferase [Bacteroidetes bacterium]|nr:MAG: 1-acyl-sn-glycerol-3-phosphate acyltransferase [Bacteroidota bacterium]